MSQPENPLNIYRSYSYHHILIACDSTNTAERLSKESDIIIFNRDVEFDPRNADVIIPRDLPSGDGKYVVLVDGTTDTQFYISSAKWETVVIPDTTSGGNQYFNTMEVDGELEIVEPKGVRFLNILANVSDALEMDPMGMIFMLKTIFVGHTHQGTTVPHTATKAMLFIPYDITASVTEAASTYVLSFVGVANGAGKMPYIASITDGFTLDLGSEGCNNIKTIAQAIEHTKTEIKNHYADFKDRLIHDLQKAKSDVDIDGEYQDIIYDIILDEEYTKPRFKIGTNEQTYKQTTGKNDPVITQGNSIGIEELINTIMQSSEEVMKEARGEGKASGNNKTVFTYKITSTLDTSIDQFKIIYYVQRWEHVLVEANPDGSANFTPSDTDGTLVLDYIFTGKNVDIINFDIKMEMGMAFFQTVVAANSPRTKTVLNHSGIAAGNKSKNRFSKTNVDGTPSVATKGRTPLSLGTVSKSLITKNKRFPLDSILFNSMLARHAALENVEASVKIRGNPQLLNESTILPSEMMPKSSDDVEKDSSDRIFKNFNGVPGYVKINIMMPNKNSDGDFATPFWYQGWYNVYSISNHFENGEFIQELELFSIPTDQGHSDASFESPEGDPDVNETVGSANLESSCDKKAGEEAKTQ